ncbi:MAG: HmuY family protein [Saprospiraceae bacterium]|nr:HmuY family protein [Saprospiraceae bacterium]
MKNFNFLFCASLVLALASCKKEEVVVQVVPVTVKTVKDIAANPSDAPSANYTFFSFEKGVLSVADSATTNWDLAFRTTTILVNSGTSGPGTAQAAVFDGIFDQLTEVPANLTFTSDSPTAKAIPTGSGKGWYNYNTTTNIITPIAGKVMFVKTSSGKYAKFEIVSYYKGAPTTVGAGAVGRYYTLRYAYQPDGTTSFK